VNSAIQPKKIVSNEKKGDVHSICSLGLGNPGGDEGAERKERAADIYLFEGKC
jgi:hypothetical protein